MTHMKETLGLQTAHFDLEKLTLALIQSADCPRRMEFCHYDVFPLLALELSRHQMP